MEKVGRRAGSSVREGGYKMIMMLHFEIWYFLLGHFSLLLKDVFIQVFSCLLACFIALASTWAPCKSFELKFDNCMQLALISRSFADPLHIALVGSRPDRLWPSFPYLFIIWCCQTCPGESLVRVEGSLHMHM